MSEAKIVLTAEDRTRAAFESVKKNLGGVNDLAKLAGFSLASLGSAASLAGLTAMVRSIANSLDAFNDLKDATGASIENISALENVARRTGANFETVGQSLVKFNQALGQTMKPGTDAEKVLKAIGLSAQQLRDMDPAEALHETALALNRFADDGNKARAVQELFGKSLREVAPFLKDLAEAGKPNATVTAKQAEEAEKFNKQLSQLQTNMGDVARAIANPLVANMNKMVEMFRLAKSEGRELSEVLGAMRAFATGGVIGGWRHLTRDSQNEGRERLGDTLGELADVRNRIERSRLRDRPTTDIGAQFMLKQEADLIARRNAMWANQVTPAEATDALSRSFGRGSINLPPEADPKTEAAAKAAAASTLREAQRVAEERQKLRNKESEDIAKFFQDQEELARKAALAQIEFQQKLSDAYGEHEQKAFASIIERTNAVQLEIDGHGRLRSQIEEVTLARLEEIRVAMAAAGEDLESIDARIQAHQKLIAVLKGRETQEATAKAADAAKQQWDSVAQSMTDSLMRGGRSAAQYLKDLFRTLVLRPLLAPVGQAMSQFVGGGGVGNAFGTAAGGGGFGGLGNIGGIANNFLGGGEGLVMGGMNGSGLLGGVGTAIFGSAGSYAGALGLSSAAAGSQAAMLAAQTGTFGAAGLSATAASGAAAGAAGAAGAGAGAASGALAAIGAAMPYVAIVLAIASMFVKKGGGPKIDSGAGFGVAQIGDPTTALAQADAIQKMYASMAKDVGGIARDLQVGVFSSQDPRGTAQTILDVDAGMGGTKFYDRQWRVGNVENVGRSEEELKKAMAEEVSRVLLGAMQRSDVPGLLGDWLRSLGDVVRMSSKEVEDALARLSKASGERKALDEAWFQMTHTAAEIQARDRQREIEALDITNRAQGLRVHALQDEIAKQQLAQAVYAQASQAIAELRLNLGGYVDRLNATPAGLLSPESQLANSKAQFAIQLAKAKAGDRNAMQGITGYADQLISAQVGYTASGTATQDTISYVKQALTDLPNMITAEEVVAQSVQDGALLLNATMEQLIARADANSAAQIAAITGQAQAENAVTAAQSSAREAAHVQSLIAQASAPQAGGLFGMIRSVASRSAALRELHDLGVSGYADGGDYSGGYVHMVGERGPELRAGGAARYWSAEQTARMVGGSGDPQLRTEVQGLRQDVARLTAVVAAGARGTIEGIGVVAGNTGVSARSAQLKAAEATA